MATLKEAQDLLSRFDGRITWDHAAHTEFKEEPPIIIPANKEAVTAAFALSQAAGKKTFVRSGRLVAASDVKRADGAAVVSLEELNTVEIDLAYITVGPAASTGGLATKLKTRQLFVPLGDQPSRSMASVALASDRPPFPRSVGKHLLWEGVEKAEVLWTEGPKAGKQATLGRASWRKFRQEGGGVLTGLTINAGRWQRFAVERWIRVWMMPYSPAYFSTLCTELLQKNAPGKVDLSLRVSRGGHSTTIIVIRATGQGDDRSESARRFVRSAVRKANCPILWSENIEGPGDSIAAWVGTGPARASGNEVVEPRFSERLWGEVDESRFLAQVDKIVKEEGGWIDFHRGSLLRRIIVPSTALATVPKTFAAAAATTIKVAKDGIGFVGGLVAPGFELSETHVEGPITGFKGEVFQRAVGNHNYNRSVEQYATSSYPRETIDARMKPHLVAVPTDAEDVVLAVQHAAKNTLKVVARSGGHQYCGLSSGGNDTLVIDLKLLRDVTFSSNKTHVTLGPGVRLEDLTRELVNRKLSIPHGECPIVNLGGHIQTGGVGHQLRGLGLALDWVRAFKMVTRNATGHVSEQTFIRPATTDTSAGAQAFRAVLGGGPGSWGVLTEITLEVVPDATHPDSRGITKTYPYHRNGWAVAMDQLRLWSELQSTGSLPAEVDLFLTVLSNDVGLDPRLSLRPGVLLLETSSLTSAGFPRIKAVVDAVSKEIPFFKDGVAKVADWLTQSPNGPAPLSHIVDHGVRRRGCLVGMPEGREFSLPYKKSLYVSRIPLPAAFCERFVDLVDRVYEHKRAKVVFQAVIGGGRFRANAAEGATRMQHRDALVQIVFDVFYEPGSVAVAEDFQTEMLALWKEHLPTETRRLFWGTYEDADSKGAQLDMSQPDTQERYYDSDAEYKDLQKVKAQLDPGDVFRTSFTVRLPKP